MRDWLFVDPFPHLGQWANLVCHHLSYKMQNLYAIFGHNILSESHQFDWNWVGYPCLGFERGRYFTWFTNSYFRPICPLFEYFIYMYFHAKPYFLKTPKTKYFSFFTTRISWKLLPCFIYSDTRVYKSSIFRMSRLKILGHFYNMGQHNMANLLLAEDD